MSVLDVPGEAFAGIGEVETSGPSVVVDVCDILAKPYEPPTLLVDPWLPQASLGLFGGDSGSAKTSLMLHVAVAIAVGGDVAQRFAIRSPGTVLYLCGEMGESTLKRYAHEAIAGLGTPLPRDRLVFEGHNGVAEFRFPDEQQRSSLEARIAQLRPSLVVFDTARALLEIDENDSKEVRAAFGWLRQLVNRYECTIIVLHHVRKIGGVSNSSRERLAGSRDLIAVVDFVLHAKSRNGKPLHALELGKTRSPVPGATQGTEWPIDARLVFSQDGAPVPRSLPAIRSTLTKNVPAPMRSRRRSGRALKPRGRRRSRNSAPIRVASNAPSIGSKRRAKCSSPARPDASRCMGWPASMNPKKGMPRKRGQTSDRTRDRGPEKPYAIRD